MKETGILYSLKNLIFQDVKSENETKRTAVILRLLTVIMWGYYLILLAMFVLQGGTLLFEASIPCGLLYLLAFYWTYQDRTKMSLALANAVTLGWVVVIVYVLGWGSGVQHFLFVLMMLVFLTSHLATKWKAAYAVSLCFMRLFLYLYTLNHKPIYRMGETVSILFQFLNTITICSIIIATMYLYSKDSMEMEKKLMLYNDKLQRIASIDPLTGLGNRRNILEYLEKSAEDYRKGSIANLSVALGDIDFFKKINDRYGHECGDIVLKRLAVLMERKLEGKALAGRWGGEEFLLVLPGFNGDEATSFISELMFDIRKMVIEYGEEQVKLTMTFGVTEYDFRKGTDETIKEADRKLYLGKESGRNRIVF